MCLLLTDFATEYRATHRWKLPLIWYIDQISLLLEIVQQTGGMSSPSSFFLNKEFAGPFFLYPAAYFKKETLSNHNENG